MGRARAQAAQVDAAGEGPPVEMHLMGSRQPLARNQRRDPPPLHVIDRQGHEGIAGDVVADRGARGEGWQASPE